jgi:hypothetical protein
MKLQFLSLLVFGFAFNIAHCASVDIGGTYKTIDGKEPPPSNGSGYGQPIIFVPNEETLKKQKAYEQAQKEKPEKERNITKIDIGGTYKTIDGKEPSNDGSGYGQPIIFVPNEATLKKQKAHEQEEQLASIQEKIKAGKFAEAAELLNKIAGNDGKKLGGEAGCNTSLINDSHIQKLNIDVENMKTFSGESKTTGK